MKKTDDLSNKFDLKIQHPTDTTDRKSDKTEPKIDKVIYFFLARLFLQGGFDTYIRYNGSGGGHTQQTKFKMIPPKEGSA